MIDILTMYYRNHFGIVQSDHLYPIQCGRSDAREKEILEMDGDDTGMNISGRNKYWSEITGLYWYWKNCNFSEEATMYWVAPPYKQYPAMTIL